MHLALNKDIEKKYIEMAKYPQPNFRREETIILNGEWNFIFDPKDKGIQEKWHKSFPLAEKKITVPYVYQSQNSGIHIDQTEGKRDIVWYNRSFKISNYSDSSFILNFGAVDYYTQVFINGEKVGEHKGGFTPFKFEINKYIKEGENELTVRVEDYPQREDILRGKQFWEGESRSIWYTPSTGIWQDVWIEKTGHSYLSEIRMTPFLDEGTIEFWMKFNLKKEVDLQVEIKKDDQLWQSVEIVAEEYVKFSVDVLKNKIFHYNYHEKGYVWDVDNPALFDVTVKLVDQGAMVDRVDTYTAMRKIHYEDGIVWLNNRPFYQRLVLDQGYWPKGLMTGTSDEHLKDILLAKKMGFNGARKHEKLESAHYYFWADVLGFAVWAEMPSAIMYSSDVVKQTMLEWHEAINARYNHPSIIAWVPLNESWGVSNISNDEKQLHHALSLYSFVKSLDLTRLIVNNDGWELSKSDIVAVHNYVHGNKDELSIRKSFIKMFDNKNIFLSSLPAQRHILLKDFETHLENKPIMLTEFGGINYSTEENDNWGYSTVTDANEFLSELEEVFTIVIDASFIQGFCYTQLYDVEQETNGLLTYERKPKVDLGKINSIVTKHKFIFKQ